MHISLPPPPLGQAEGFVVNGEVRRVPFEVMVEGDKVPVYEETLEDDGRYNEQPTLPFNAFGTLAIARSEFEANSGSSQVFFLLKVGFGGGGGGAVQRLRWARGL
jgi:hypothetical protein